MFGYICLGSTLLWFIPLVYTVIRGCIDKKYRERLDWKAKVANRWVGLNARKRERQRPRYAPYRPAKGTLMYRIWKKQGRI